MPRLEGPVGFGGGVPADMNYDQLIQGNPEWLATLTPAERGAISRYTSGGYRRLNYELREVAAGRMSDLSPDSLSLQQQLDAILTKAPPLSGEPWHVFRGVTIPKPSGPGLYTDQEIYDAVADVIARKYQPGDVIDMGGGFVSTSIDPQPALDAALGRNTPGVVFEIRTNRGIYLQGVSEYDDEFEVLLGRAATFTVEEVVPRYELEDAEGGTVVRTVVRVIANG